MQREGFNGDGTIIPGFYYKKGMKRARPPKNPKEQLYVRLRDGRRDKRAARPEGYISNEAVTSIPTSWGKNTSNPYLRHSAYSSVQKKNLGTFGDKHNLRKILPIDPKAQAYLQFTLAPKAFSKGIKKGIAGRSSGARRDLLELAKASQNQMSEAIDVIKRGAGKGWNNQYGGLQGLQGGINNSITNLSNALQKNGGLMLDMQLAKSNRGGLRGKYAAMSAQELADSKFKSRENARAAARARYAKKREAKLKARQDKEDEELGIGMM